MKQFLQLTILSIFCFLSMTVASQNQRSYETPNDSQIKKFIKTTSNKNISSDAAGKANYLSYYKDLFQNRIIVNYKIGISEVYPQISTKGNNVVAPIKITSEGKVKAFNILDYDIDLSGNEVQYFSLGENTLITILPQKHFRN